MAYQKLSRKSGPRRALLRSQVTALLKEGRLETTAAKAKAVRPLAEQMITLARKGGSTPAGRPWPFFTTKTWSPICSKKLGLALKAGRAAIPGSSTWVTAAATERPW